LQPLSLEGFLEAESRECDLLGELSFVDDLIQVAMAVPDRDVTQRKSKDCTLLPFGQGLLTSALNGVKD
jgi:hypothetical protein